MTIDPPKTGTEIGNYFVSNYPPFSQWKPEFVGEALAALDGPPRVNDALGLYIHIPFCRKRCKFCYFKVYTDKNASEIEVYLDALIKENELYSRSPAFQGRQLRFAYFGGGTPSYVSEKQLHYLVSGLNRHVSWANAEEVTFECEPGTLQKSKLEALKEIGVTRLSLGIEHFDDEILASNGRAHLSPEIYRAYGWAREVDFPQINIDLISGMMGESEEKWRETVRRAIELEADSVTIYQMELPYNTVISQDILKQGVASPIAGWDTKRRWVQDAFEALERAGYHIGSAYTAVRNPDRTKFIYRDRLWQGADMAGLGVASFGHVNGVHLQNKDTWEGYSEPILQGELPLGRAYRPTPEEAMRRELILQMKLGKLRPAYFSEKYGVDVLKTFASELAALRAERYVAEATPERLALTRDGLMRVDSLLPRFFLPQHTNIRYT